MRQTFIKHSTSSTSLILFFSGWGSEPCMFRSCMPEEGTDMLMCWDYRNMDFDPSFTGNYSKITVMAWSMGVWAAGHALSGLELPITGKVAVCGTPFPIDDSKGIPVRIFDGTLENLTDRTLAKFQRRMCGSGEALAALKETGIQRDTVGMKEELAAIRDFVHADEKAGSIPSGLAWDRAIAGNNDMIFPAENQNRAWESLNVPVIRTESAHFDANLLNSLPNMKEIWTNI